MIENLPIEIPSGSLSPEDLQDLQNAVVLLTSPSLTTKLTSIVGSPIEYLMDKMPKDASDKIQKVIETSLHKVFDVSANTMQNEKKKEASNKWHKFGAGLSGAIGGFFGFSAIMVELPVSTTIMMRSILDVARSEGFDITDPKTKLECLSVFGFTANEDKQDDSAESGYYASRIALNQIMSATAKELAVLTQGAAAKTIDTSIIGKALAQLISNIASRLSIPLTEKVAAQLVPGIGAAAGATINVMFTGFYQEMAKGHFTVKRLEQKYGEETVKCHFDQIRQANLAAQSINKE